MSNQCCKINIKENGQNEKKIVMIDPRDCCLPPTSMNRLIHSHVKGTLVEKKKQNLISSQNSLQYTSEAIVLVSAFCINLCAS